MPKIVIKFRGVVRGEIPLIKKTTLIGRAPTNEIPINNLAVSRKHAEIQWNGSRFVIKDLNSSNGTYIHGRRIQEKPLEDGDLILVGKHTLLFVDQDAGNTHTAEAFERHRDPDSTMRSTMEWEAPAADKDEDEDEKNRTTINILPPAPERSGQLSVHKGQLARSTYDLIANATIIGKGKYAEVRLTGWRAPLMAAVIHRRGQTYFLTPSETGITLNGKKLLVRRQLSDGDIIGIQDVLLRFHAVGGVP